MKNMIKNQTLFFISLIGIIVVSSIMLTTYAYQTLRVDYVSGSKNDVSVSSGVLDVNFVISNKIDIKNMPLLPSYKTADFIEFDLDNTKSSSKVAYMISLVELEYSKEIVDGYFRYTIVRVNDDESLEEIGSGSFANLTDNYITLYFNKGIYEFVEMGKIDKLRLYLWFKESKNVEQNKLQKSSFKGKINISSVFSSDVSYEIDTSLFSSGTLANKIVSDSILGLNGTQYSPSTMSMPLYDVSEEYEKTLSTIKDNLGTSYYYRGNVSNNYINFNNMCFRIVRILGDGSIKLILEDDKNVCESSSNLTLVNNIDEWYKNNKFVELETYIKKDSTCQDGYDSYKVLDTDKDTYVLRSNGKVYGFVNNTFVEMNEDNYRLQCDEFIGKNQSVSTEEVLYCNEWYYDNYRRLYGKESEKKVSLSCDRMNYESYVNNLMVDEAILAGFVPESNNNTNYLKTTEGWWTSSNAYYSIDKEYKFYIGSSLLTDHINNNYEYRPTIVLNSNILYDSGDGTKTNPYNIKYEVEES